MNLAEADKIREAIKGKENDSIKEEKESMLYSYDDMFFGVLPLDSNCRKGRYRIHIKCNGNCIQKPPMIQPTKQQTMIHYQNQ